MWDEGVGDVICRRHRWLITSEDHLMATLVRRATGARATRSLVIRMTDAYRCHVNAPAPALLPLLRSENQLRLLVALLLDPTRRYTVTELARATRVAQPSVSREVTTLVDLGLVTAELDHGRRLLTANPESPIFPEVSSLVLKTAGPAVVVARHLSGAVGIVEAHLYGSWARRHTGEPGPAPGDIDVLVVGTVNVADVRRRTDAAGQKLSRDVNVTVLSAREWDEPSSGFVRHVRASPLVPLELTATPDEGRPRR